jgi:hypothetical protein
MERSLPAAGRDPFAATYERRRPEETVLYRTVQAELGSFLDQARRRDRPVPHFVERELRAYLACGILAFGFLRVHCDACGHDRLVAFSCKGRGFCPSCGGRRMADTAAHLVDRVFPEVPVRQWVLTVPFVLRYRMAYDAGLTSAVLRELGRAVFACLRRRARRHGPVPRPQAGAVTFLQRFGDALNLNVHFHTLALDGVYAGYGRPGMRFRALPPPEDIEVRRVVERVARRVGRLLARRGLGAEADAGEADPLAGEQPLLAGLAAASVRGRAADGRRLVRLGDRVDPEDLPASATPRCATAGGFSLHAGVAVPARDRQRLERLCRYAGRPPLATERLERLVDGRLLYRLRHRWRDGTTHVVFEPQELLQRLVPLIPAPGAHQVRYHGVLAPCASWRRCIVREALPARKASRLAPCRAAQADTTGSRWEGLTGSLSPPDRGTGETTAAAGRPSSPAAMGTVDPADTVAGQSESPPERRRHAWAELLRRVFAADVMECPRCGGRLRILAAIHPPAAIQAILDCLGLPSRAPPLAAAPRDPSDPALAADG